MPKALDTYRVKRDFKRTPEPSGVEGRAIARSEHMRFVIQKHDATRLHYDLRLELDGVFKSWAVTKGPSLDPAERRLAIETEDHPLEYGDFEGTIPEGEYGGGTVMLWDRGYWAPETKEAPERSLAKSELKFILAGSKLQGSWVLVRLKGRRGEKKTPWLLIKHRDKWATPGNDDIQAKDKSAASGRSMAQIAAGKGRAPKPFMTEGTGDGAAAVWDERLTQATRKRARAQLAARPISTDVALPKLTHPERELWPAVGGEPAITKLDLAHYLMAVAPWMIHHLAGRPCSLIRAPDGIGSQTFFQRHPMPGQPGNARAVKVDGDHEPYLEIDDAQTLVTQAQISALEFHPWNCVPFAPEIPGRLVFDFDPAEDVAFDDVVAAARELKARLERLGLVPFAKTTGGKGIHVVVPLTIDETVSWDEAKLFAQTICAQMAADSPERYIARMTKAARKGRIYLDYLRNDSKATAVAPLSPRARPGALVSMPLDWGQAKKGLDPTRFTLRKTPALLARSKPWAEYTTAARPLRDAVLKLVGSRP